MTFISQFVGNMCLTHVICGHTLFQLTHYSNSHSIRKHWWALLVGAVAGLAVFATVLGVWWRSYASEYTKASVEDALSPVVGAFDGLVGGIRGRFSGAAAARAAQEEYFQPLEGGVGLELGAEDVRSPSLLHNSK